MLAIVYIIYCGLCDLIDFYEAWVGRFVGPTMFSENLHVTTIPKSQPKEVFNCFDQSCKNQLDIMKGNIFLNPLLYKQINS